MTSISSRRDHTLISFILQPPRGATMGLGRLERGVEWRHDGYRDETRASGLIAACALTGVASVIILALRFLSRRLLHGRLRLETSDWFILVAWVSFVMVDIALAVGAQSGIGRHATTVEDFHKIQILAVVSEAAYFLAISFVKFSILASYFKAFPVRKFRYCVWGVSIFVIGWGMAGAVVAVFQCTSIESVWRPEDRGSCINLGLWNRISGVMNVVAGIIIIVMVIPLVGDLHVTKHKRWMVLTTFAVGTGACIVSIVRVPFSLQVGTDDETWNTVPTAIVSVTEMTLGMLAVSIPTYRPLHEHIFGGGGGMCRKSNGTNPCRYKDTLHMGFYAEGTRNDVNVTSRGNHIGCPHAGINVTNHIELVRHTNKSGNWVRVTDEDEEELCRSREQMQTKDPS
ncbi:hypothetical protein F5Y14DRAFT_391642 [Nemania sp. NC0429]|nr:hypothetical protein F5Y14DRAFT_391642 [Nemania sp. NC0429]